MCSKALRPGPLASRAGETTPGIPHEEQTMLHPAHPVDAEGNATAARFAEVRVTSLALAESLSEADQTVQSMPDASPTKWHLAHTTWFFETFVLAPSVPGFRSPHPAYAELFNSYYE